jgi:hypothetical protein
MQENSGRGSTHSRRRRQCHEQAQGQQPAQQTTVKVAETDSVTDRSIHWYILSTHSNGTGSAAPRAANNRDSGTVLQQHAVAGSTQRRENSGRKHARQQW